MPLEFEDSYFCDAEYIYIMNLYVYIMNLYEKKQIIIAKIYNKKCFTLNLDYFQKKETKRIIKTYQIHSAFHAKADSTVVIYRLIDVKFLSFFDIFKKKLVTRKEQIFIMSH